jgi:mRNA-degrading endonuclease toxin of MazEF toxin-antitoxin module
MFRRGHVYWVKMPGEHERRPALVLSPDRRNERATTVVVVPCTTVKRPGPWHVHVRRGEGGLDRDSVIKCEEVTMLAKEHLVPTALGGPLSAARLDEIRTGILRALDYE